MRQDLMMQEKSTHKLLWNFAAPAIAGLLANALYNIADRIFVGQTVGALGLGAIALALPFMLLFIAVGMLVGIGMASRVSILLGQKNTKEAARTIGTGMTLVVILSLITVVAIFSVIKPLLMATGAGENLYPVAADYLGIVLFGATFLTTGFAASYVLRALGYPRLAMATQFLGAGLNILLDWWFVWNLHWGVQGAAAATAISQLGACTFSVTMLIIKSKNLKVRREYLRPVPEIAKRIMAVGMPPAIMEAGFTIILAMMNRQVQRYGGDIGVSAIGIFFGIDALMFLPAVGIMEGAQPIIGYNYGSGNMKRVKDVTWLGVKAAAAYFLVTMIVIEFFPGPLVKLFNSTDQVLIDLAVEGLRISYLGMPLSAMTLMSGCFFMAIGRAKEALIISICRFTIFIMLPLMTLPPILGLRGVWMTFPASDVMGCILGFLMVRHAMKKL